MKNKDNAKKKLEEQYKKIVVQFEPCILEASRSFNAISKALENLDTPKMIVPRVEIQNVVMPQIDVQPFIKLHRAIQQLQFEAFDYIATHVQKISELLANFTPFQLLDTHELQYKVSQIQFPIQRIISQIEIEKIKLLTDFIDDIDIDDLTVTDEDLNEVLQDIVDEKVNERIDEIVADKKKQPFYVRYLLAILIFIYSIIQNAIYDYGIKPVIDSYIEHREVGFFSNQNKAAKFLKEEFIRAEVPKEIFSNFRIVTKDYLKVYHAKTHQSRVVGELHSGDVVQIIKKQRNWCYVVYSEPENDLVIKGWVFTRYLKKIE